jgi:hypothetical protein
MFHSPRISSVPCLSAALAVNRRSERSTRLRFAWFRCGGCPKRSNQSCRCEIPIDVVGVCACGVPGVAWTRLPYDAHTLDLLAHMRKFCGRMNASFDHFGMSKELSKVMQFEVGEDALER